MPLTFSQNFEQIIDELDLAAAQAVEETTREIVEQAKALAPVDTSSLQQSIHAVLPGNSDYASAQAAARRANSSVEILPPISVLDDEPGVHQGIVDVAAAHGVFIHDGTGDRAARPFLEEAALGADKTLEERLRAKLRRL